MYDLKALYEASSVQNAVELRLEHPEAQIIAGGSDVLVQMREGKRAGKELISIYGLDELSGVSIDENDSIRIGSLTSFSHITRDPIIQKYINVLGQAVDMVGGPQIRNIGTIGGNTCNGVTSRRLRLHPPRVGGHSRAHRQRGQAPAAHTRLLHKGRPCGHTPGRDTDRHNNTQGQL